MRRMTTAIISALPEEQTGLAQLLQAKEQLAQPPRLLQRGYMHDKPVILALAGIGKVAAAMTATMLIERHHVQRILFTGVAGGIGADVKVGDVVLGQEYLQHDMDTSPLFPKHEIPLTGISRFVANTDLFAIVLRAIQ
jgi:adenosylhomocysteine nucleosidase